MSKFKVGDWVKRTGMSRGGVEIGSIYRVHGIIGEHISLKELVGEGSEWHVSNFELHSRPSNEYPTVLTDNEDLYLSRWTFVLYSHIKQHLETISQDEGGLIFYLPSDKYTFSLEEGTKLLNRLSEEGVLSGNTIQ